MLSIFWHFLFFQILKDSKISVLLDPLWLTYTTVAKIYTYPIVIIINNFYLMNIKLGFNQ